MRLLIIIIFILPQSLSGQVPRLMVPTGHVQSVYSAEFTPNGKWVVTSSEDKTVKVWDANTGRLVSEFRGLRANLNNAVLCPNGKWVAATCVDDTVRIWDFSTEKIIGSFYGAINGNSKTPISYDSKYIVTTSYRGHDAFVWEISTGKLLFKLANKEVIISAMFSPDGKSILAILSEFKCRIWNAFSGEQIAELIGHRNIISSVSFAKDGRRIATTSLDSTAKIWDISSSKAILELKGHRHKILSSVFSSDGNKLITTSLDGTAKLWDANTGDLILDFKKHLFSVEDAAFSADCKKVVTCSTDGAAIVWDVNSGNVISVLKGHNRYFFHAKFSPDTKKIVTVTENKSVEIWEAKTGRLLLSLISPSFKIFEASFSPDGKMIATASWDSTAKVWDILRAELISVCKGNHDYVQSSNFSPDGRMLLTASADRFAKKWNVLNGLPVKNYFGHKLNLTYAEFSPNGKLVVTTSLDSNAKIWDAISGKPISTLKGHQWYLNRATFSHDSKRVVTVSPDKTAKVWDVFTGQLLFDLTGHKWGVNSASFSTDDRFIITGAGDATAKLWDARDGLLVLTVNTTSAVKIATFFPEGNEFITTGFDYDSKLKFWNSKTGALVKTISTNKRPSEIFSCLNFSNNLIAAVVNNEVSVYDLLTGRRRYSFIETGGENYLFITPDGYYKATKSATRQLYYVDKDLKVITFEQLDIKYNRPDKVLEAIGNTDTALIKSYRNAWEKRIRKLGVDTTAFRDGYSLPEADFTNRDKIEFEQKSGLLRLNIKGLDSIYKLDRFNIWVNEAPCFGQRGISILKRNKKGFDTTISIQLSEGENRIETSIINVNGTESYRIPLVLNYSPDVKQKATTHFVGIGIDEFKDNNRNLKFSRKDIVDLARKLREKYGDSIVIDTLFNEKVTIANIKALKQKLLKTTVNDKVILAYSGHGLLNKDFDYYLSTFTVNFEKPEQNGLPYDELESLLDSIPARKKLLLIDACHSGELDKDEVERIRSMSDSLKHNGVNANESKGIDPVKNKSHLGMQNSFELMQSLFVNVSRNTGATIIAAAGGTQFALEKGDLQNGVFTYSILEAMNKYPYIKVSELKKIVGERVEQLTNGLQKPALRNETIAVDWNVW